MLILGIGELDNDSGASLIKDSETIAAANEERFSRVKQQDGVPAKAIDWMLRKAGATFKDLDEILCVRQDVHSEYSHDQRQLDQVAWFSYPGPMSWKVANYGIWRFRNYRKRLELSKLQNQRLLDWARDHGIERSRIERPDHHLMHAACAYYGSGFDEALAFTVDGWGDGKTATLYACRNGRFELIHEVMLPHSAGVFYAAVTRAAGYRPFRHEGKITGLAAHGAYDEECMTFARMGLYNVNGSFEAPYNYGSYPWLRRLIKKKGPENLAYAYQLTLEDVMAKYVAQYVKSTGLKNLCLAGGVAANVRVNQKLHEVPGVEKTFVFPHMADGGLGWGAAMWAWHRSQQRKLGDKYHYEPKRIHNVYWGPDFTEDEMRQELERERVRFTRPDDIDLEMATYLAEGELIARFNGAMEFGPRALCHRSILYQPTDPTVNVWLNERLHRTEFMPFAPVTLEEDAPRMYKNMTGAEHPANFMTITFDCTEEMARSCPAVVHIDGTARPQTIRPDLDNSTYRTLKFYKEKTGLSSMINTSFNMHEEPIICTPADAIRGARSARFRYLAMGPFLCEFDNPSPPPRGK